MYNKNESAALSMLLLETKSLNYESISMPLTDGCFDKWVTSQKDGSVLSIGSAIPLSIPFDTAFFSDVTQENVSMRSPLEKRKPHPALVRLCLGFIGKQLEDGFDGMEVLTSFSPDIKMAITTIARRRKLLDDTRISDD
nr:hypothetical protein [Tanacetum cinerariifolium]